MRRLPLTIAASLLLSSCGDDLSDQEPGTTSGSTSSGTGADMDSGGSFGPTTEPPTTTMTPADSSSTGPATECGNGVIEDGEECDDENVEDGDECYSNCTIPYEVLWTETHHGDGVDRATEALFDGAGNLYVLGDSTIGDNRDLWLRQYDPDGNEGWTFTYAGPLGGDDFSGGMAWHQSGDLLITGSVTTENADDILVMRLGIDDQVPVWEDIYDGPGLGPGLVDDVDFGTSIAGAANGDVLVTGNERVDGEDTNMWIRRYTAVGNEVWTLTFNGMFSGFDDTDAILEDDNGDIYVVGNTEFEDSMSQMWVRKYNAKGMEIWTDGVTNVIANNATLDPDGNLVVVGIDISGPNIDMWIGKFDSDFNLLSSTALDGPSGIFDSARAVVTDASGDVYMAGNVTVVGSLANVWMGRFDPDLQMRWRNTYGNQETDLDDLALGIAVSDDSSRVAVVGFESVVFEETNIWVRMYQNNPAP